MSWIDSVPASQMGEWRDAGRIGGSRFEGPLDPEPGPELEPCSSEPHEPHWDEYGTCPGVTS